MNPAGGILEKCRVKYDRDEGCAIADWLRLNLDLARVTGKARYWAMAERTLHNHFLQNQTPKGGFGHRNMLCDKDGVCGFEGRIEEAVWCCTFHGQLGFVNLREHLVSFNDTVLTSNFALDFSGTNSTGRNLSEIRAAAGPGEVMRQRIRLSGMPAKVIRVRKPHWANAVTAVDAGGKDVVIGRGRWFCCHDQAAIGGGLYLRGGVYAENRHCARLADGPVAGEPCVFGYGPKIFAVRGRAAPMPVWPTSLVNLQAQGLLPFAATTRTQDCCFVCTGPNHEVRHNLAPAALDLSGEWRFQLDAANTGVKERWFTQQALRYHKSAQLDGYGWQRASEWSGTRAGRAAYARPGLYRPGVVSARD